MARIPMPQALSVGEETFALHMRMRGLQPWREYQFCPGRKWRFDFALVKHVSVMTSDGPIGSTLKVAVEIEGGVHSGGRHTRGEGFIADIEKYNTAALMGWLVLRYTTQMVKSGLAEREVAKLMGVV